MPTIPTSVISTPTEFQPAFTRVQQSENHDCAFACVAMITGKTLEEIRELAVKKFMHPIHGPYWITGDLIAGLLAQNGYVASVYKEVDKVEILPDLAIAMVDYQPSTELGRYVLFHRAKASHDSKSTIAYIVDPAYWVEPQEHIRTSFKTLPVSWCIAVHAMNKPGK